MRAFGGPAHRLAFTHALVDNVTHAGLGWRTGDSQTIADISLHLFQDVFTLLKRKPYLLGCNSTSATIEFGNLFHGKSLASEAGFKTMDSMRVSSVAVRSANTPPQLLHSGRRSPRLIQSPTWAIAVR